MDGKCQCGPVTLSLLYSIGRQPVLLAFCPQVAYNLQCEPGVCLQCASLNFFLMIAVWGEGLG